MVIKMSRHLVNVFRASTCTIYVLSLIIRTTVFDGVIYDRTYELENISLMKDPFIFHLNGTVGLHLNFNYSRSKCQPFVSTYRVTNNLQDMYVYISWSITVYINLSRKHRLFHGRI